MEDKINSVAVERLKGAVPEIKISTIDSKIGSNFWSFELQDRSVSGAGAASRPNIALEKSISEFVERHALKHNSRTLGSSTSSGFAAHVDERSARESSVAELMERDAFLICWFAQVLPAWIPLDRLKLDSRTGNVLQTVLRQGIRLKIGILAQTGCITVACGMADFEACTANGAAFAFASEADYSPEQAIEKVTISLFRISNLILTRKSLKSELFEKFESKDVKQPFQHLEYYLNPIHRRLLEPWWDSQKTNILAFEQPVVETQIIPHALADVMERKVAYSRSAEVLNYFCGVTQNSSAVKNRLKSIGLEMKIDSNLLHPLS